MVKAYIGLGGNIGDRKANIQKALIELAQNRRCRLTKVSSFYETKPVGLEQQPDFLNLAAEIETELKPKELLAWLKEVEQKVGREKTFRWGPRIIDIDILLYDELIFAEENLEIPHPEMENRAFVLVPLAEIAPSAKHPVTGLTVREMRDALGGEGISKLASE